MTAMTEAIDALKEAVQAVQDAVQAVEEAAESTGPSDPISDPAPPNAAPFGITINGSDRATVTGDAEPGTPIGILQALDNTPEDSWDFALATDYDASHGGRFKVEGDKLLVDQGPGSNGVFPVNVKVVDEAGGGYVKTLYITVEGSMPAPTPIPPTTSPPPTGSSKVYPKVSIPVPGKNLISGDKWQGDFIVGLTSAAPLKAPGAAPNGSGMSFDGSLLWISSAANGSIISGWDLSAHSVAFQSGVSGVIFEQNKHSTGGFDLYNGAPENITVRDSDMIAPKGSTAPGGAWISNPINFYTFQRNFCAWSAADVLKADAGLIEDNYLYGGGQREGAHFDGLQTNGLNGPLTIRRNRIDGVADGDTHGGTNFARLIPNSPGEPKNFPVRAYNNIIRGFGWQCQVSPEYTDVQVYDNFQGDWVYGPVEGMDKHPNARYYGNRQLYTGELLVEYRKP